MLTPADPSSKDIMHTTIDTIIIGAGQAGLATSYHLSRQGRTHLVLERAAQAAPSWRHGRWDSFTLVTPNWSFRLPGAAYDGAQPQGFMGRDEVVARLDRYIADHALPVRYNIDVTAVRRTAAGTYLVETGEGTFEADNVVVATGLFQRPARHPASQRFPERILQLHSSDYRRPAALPEGAVLVVGSSQSGAQIADELRAHGRQVYLCVGSSGRAPRSYRGKDSSEWQELLGLAERTVDMLPSPAAKFAANPHVVGRIGGGNLNLHQFARDGIVLLGRLVDADAGRIRLAADLHENLTKADAFEAQFTGLVDKYIAANDLDFPPEQLPQLTDGFSVTQREELDLLDAGITSVIWAAGYSFDFGLVKLPVLDSDGYPLQKRGVTAYPGLYFVGLPWLHNQKSGLLSGIGDDAAHIAAHLAARHDREGAPATGGQVDVQDDIMAI